MRAMVGDDGNHYLVDPAITLDWLREHDRRASMLNTLLTSFRMGLITTVDDTMRRLIQNLSAYQLAWVPPAPGQTYGVVKMGPPLIEDTDYVIEARDGRLDVWVFDEAEKREMARQS